MTSPTRRTALTVSTVCKRLEAERSKKRHFFLGNIMVMPGKGAKLLEIDSLSESLDS